jgi:hypothetical protein
VRVVDPQAVLRAVSERLFDHRTQMMQIDDDVVKPVAFQEQQIPDDQGGSGNWEQRFGDRIGERPQARAEAGREDHRLHEENGSGLLKFRDILAHEFPQSK